MERPFGFPSVSNIHDTNSSRPTVASVGVINITGLDPLATSVGGDLNCTKSSAASTTR